MTDTRRKEAVRDLLWEWDPLGDDNPTDPHLPKNEYDWLVRGVERELDGGAHATRLTSGAFICHREGGSVLTAVVQQLVVYWIHVGGP